jgi:hypothetical protein
MCKGRAYGLLMTICVLFFLVLLPLACHGADLKIGSGVTSTSGDWILGGGMTANSFSGDGNGLTNLNPANLASGAANISISGNAATATTATTASTASSVTNGVYTSGSYTDPSWIQSIGGSKVSGDISGNATNVTGTVAIANGGTGSTTASGALTNLGAMSKYSKVAIVAQSGGDYTDPVTALELSNVSVWCGTPSATNPCLLKIMPGKYTVTSPVVMQAYIDIEGSGEKTTKITGAFSNSGTPPAGAVHGADNAEIRFLTVENTGNSSYTAAIFNSYASPSMLHVTSITSGGSVRIGVYNTHSSPIMVNVTATGAGGLSTYGVWNESYSSPAMTNVTATGSGGTNGNTGIYNSFSSPAMTNTVATGSGGNISYGVLNSQSSPAMTNVISTGSGGTTNYGIYNLFGNSTIINVTSTGSGGSTNVGIYNNQNGPFKINNSVITGSTYSVYNDGATTYVGASQLNGTRYNSGTLKCVSSYDGNYDGIAFP